LISGGRLIIGAELDINEDNDGAEVSIGGEAIGKNDDTPAEEAALVEDGGVCKNDDTSAEEAALAEDGDFGKL